MRLVIGALIILCITPGLISQAVSINNNGATADSSAMLDVQSTTKGALFPRMDSLQRQAIANPAEGLLVYDLDTHSFWYFQDSTWTDLNEANRIFQSSEGITFTRGSYNNDDFVVGSTQTDGDNNIDHHSRMFFHQGKRAFRVGAPRDTTYDTGGTVQGDATAWDEDSLGYYSVAMGFNAKAKGLRAAISLGNYTFASGLASFAAGHSTRATGGLGATALGFVSEASGGFGATALGEGTEASGNFGATALGSGCKATGDDGATAIGLSCESSGEFGAIAMGFSADATGDFGAVAIGRRVEAAGESSIVIGSGPQNGFLNPLVNNTNRSLAVGFNSTVPTLFVGPGNNTAGSLGKVGIGTTTPGSGISNIRLEVQTGHILLTNNYGIFSRNTTNNGLGAGFDTDPSDNLLLYAGGARKMTILTNGNVGIGESAPSESLTVETGSVFAQNLGNFDTNRGFLLGENESPAFGFVYDGSGGGGGNKAYIKEMVDGVTSVVMTFMGNGRVGIGTKTPDTRLDVERSGDVTSRITSTSGDDVRLDFKRQGGGNDWRIHNTSGLLLFGQSSDDLVTINDVLRLGGGSMAPASDNSVVCGQSSRRWTAVYAVNGTIQTSDADLKQDIEPIESGLAITSMLQPVSFKWKSNNTDNGKTHLGFLAQDLQEVLPEVVYDQELHVNNETGEREWQKTENLGVNYAEITPVLVKAIQEQQELIEQQQATIDDLLDRVNTLESGGN